MVSCFDVNGDKNIDIPLDYKIKKLPKEIKAIEFKNYKQYNMYHSAFALYSSNDEYLVVIPDNIINKITASYNKKSKEMTVTEKNTKATLFSVKPVLKATYDSEKYKGYSVALEDNGYCYLIKQGSSSIKISDNDLKSYIKTIN